MSNETLDLATVRAQRAINSAVHSIYGEDSVNYRVTHDGRRYRPASDAGLRAYQAMVRHARGEWSS